MKSNPFFQSLTIREKFIGTTIAFVALVLVGLVSMNTLGRNGLPFMVASMGASSVLLFAVPYSPLSQPWPFVGGHLVSSCVGITCALMIPDPILSSAAAVSLSIGAMHIARCLHPPGGAVALVAVLAGQQIHSLGYKFMLFPVLINALLLLGAAWLFNNMVPGRRYPSVRGKVQEMGDGETWPVLAYGVSSQDFRSAVNAMDEVVDITEQQLDKLYKATVLQMRKRQLGDIRCEQIMSRDVVSFKQNTSVAQAWRELMNRQVKAAPVLDYQKRVIGIVTQSDLSQLVMDKLSVDRSKQAAELDTQWLHQTPVGLVMSAPVTTIGADRHMVEAIPLLVERKIHHLPVVSANRVIKGMLSRTDLLALLAEASAIPGSEDEQALQEKQSPSSQSSA